MTTILFWLKHNIYAWKNFQKRQSEKEAERTIINTIICKPIVTFVLFMKVVENHENGE